MEAMSDTYGVVKMSIMFMALVWMVIVTIGNDHWDGFA